MILHIFYVVCFFQMVLVAFLVLGGYSLVDVDSGCSRVVFSPYSTWIRQVFRPWARRSLIGVEMNFRPVYWGVLFCSMGSEVDGGNTDGLRCYPKVFKSTAEGRALLRA